MSAVARVAVELSTGAAQAAAKKLQAGVKRLEAAVARLKPAAERAQNAFKRMADAGKRGIGALAARVKSAAKNFGGLGKAAALAAAAAGAAAFARFAFGKAGTLEKQTKSLEVLTGSLDKAKGVIKELQAFGAVTPFTSDELIETAKRLKAFGFETEQITDVTKRLADVAGATGADLGGIATAFGQIQAKGRLQGEELLQLQERGVALGDELRKMYGLSGEEFSKALEKGQISAKAANVALIRLTEQGGKYANGAVAQSDTLFGKLSTLQDAFDQFGRNIGKVLTPIFKGIIDFLTTITNQINNLFRNAEIANKVREEFGLDTTAGRAKVKRMGVKERRDFFARMKAREQELRAAGPTVEAPVIDTSIPALTAGTAAASGGGKTEAEKAAEAKQKQLAAAKELLVDFEREAQLINASTDAERDRLKLTFEKANLARQFPQLSNEELQSLRDQLDVNFGLTQADKARIEAAKQLKIEQDKHLAQVRKIADAIQTGITDAIMGAIDGSKTLSESLSGILKQIGGIFLQQGIGAFNVGGKGGSGLLGLFGGFKASGGTVGGGKSFVVGEKGPELFTPNRTGSIAPAGSFGGATVTVNVDASGSSVEGNGDEAAKLGKMLGAAVQAELVKQKRPGGLLA